VFRKTKHPYGWGNYAIISKRKKGERSLTSFEGSIDRALVYKNLVHLFV